MEDWEAWEKYPRYHKWFNKLWLSESLGYHCGPSGTAPKQDGLYIVRPVYNLSGMGVGARKVHIKANDQTATPPGYFWCEYFEGTQYSVTYRFNHDTVGTWTPISSWKAIQDSEDLWRFGGWVRSDYSPPVPRLFNQLSEIQRINIEFKGDRPIEVHLRDTPDPDYDEIVPIWKDREKDVDKYLDMGYTYVKSFDDADGFLEVPRLGFMVRNIGETKW